MKDLLRIASLLDSSGEYFLSDKLVKISQKNMPDDLSETVVMDASQYYDNPYTPKEILKLRNQLAPSDFRGMIKKFESGEDIDNSSSPEEFVNNLWEFSKRNGFTHLVDALDAYADINAKYNGTLIRDIPMLRQLYLGIKSSPRMFSKDEILRLVKSIL